MSEIRRPPKRKVLRKKATQFEIHHGDCVAGMQRLAEESVDVVMTSPPYNIGVKYGRYKDNQQREAYLNWCMEWGAGIKRVLKRDGSFFLNIGASPSNPLLPFEIVDAFAGSGLFVLQNSIHWIKAISLEMDDGSILSRGHFKPINSQRYINDCHEYVFHFSREGKTPIDRIAVGVPYMDKSNISRWGHTGGRDKRCAGNTWFIPYETIHSRAGQRPHPATFPVALAERCVRLHGVRSNLVMMDPFLGIGHAAVAAKRCGVGRFIGFDIDLEYLQVAAEKVEAGLSMKIE